MKKIIFLFCFAVFGFNQAFAIPPPDFLIQAFSNIAIYFAMGVAMLSAFFASSYIYLKDFYRRRKIITIFILVFLIFSAGFGIKYYLDEEKKKDIIIELENKKNFTKSWIDYKNLEKYNKFKDLKTKEKVDILMEEERVELEKYLFGKEKKLVSAKSISNQELKKIYINSSTEGFSPLYIILDARENIEFEIGQMPNSIHHRIADLKGKNILNKLDKTKKYIVICWGGMRGKQTAEFLLKNGFKAEYLEKGVEGWIDFGGKFNGKTELKDVFKNSKFNNYIEDLKFLENILSGTKIVDAREENRLIQKEKLPNAEFISLMYNSNKNLEKKLNSFEKKQKVIVVCDDYINCFDAQVVGIELEKRGVDLVGLYWKKGVVR